MMKPTMVFRMRPLGLLTLLLIPLTGAAQTVISYPGPLTCADQSVVARAVETPKDAEVFVQCAYEYVREMGFDEARRAFHEDERWKYGETFLYYSNRNPATNRWQRKVTFVKRVTSFGVPVLIGAGYYLD